MKAITISRQYGSGGGEVGASLAARLNWRLIDHELVAQVARELGITERTAEARDEYTEGFIARLLSRQSVYQLAPPVEYAAELTPHRTEEHRYQETLRHVVETAADSGQVVIIGRASQVILAAMAERGISWHPGQQVRALDPDRKIALLSGGEDMPYYLFLGVPVHHAPAVVA